MTEPIRSRNERHMAAAHHEHDLAVRRWQKAYDLAVMEWESSQVPCLTCFDFLPQLLLLARLPPDFSSFPSAQTSESSCLENLDQRALFGSSKTLLPLLVTMLGLCLQ